MATIARSLVLALLASCVASSGVSAADGPGSIAAAMNGAFRPLLKQYGVPGIAVAVTVDGRPYFFNYGVAAKDGNTPVTEHTLFEIGSVGKTFTATLISYAQALGRISLDDHPGKFMRQLRSSAIDKATLLNLGTYTAGGLPLQIPDAVTNDAEMIRYFQDWKPSAAPGTKRQYSNPSIGLLGHIAALAMNGDFPHLVETTIFPGLGLRHSFIRVPQAEMGRYAWGYNKAGKPIRVNPGVFDAEAYGVKSSAADMIRFVQDNIRPKTLAPPVARAVEGTHVGYFKVDGMVQGLGWEQYRYPVTLDRLLAGNSDAMTMQAHTVTQLTRPKMSSEPTLLNKTGSTNGFSAYVAFVPDRKIGIVMLANKNFPIPARVTASYAVLEALASDVH